MITDTIIETSSAKYFCVFKDKDFIAQVDSMLDKQNKDKGKQVMDKAITNSPKKQMNESALLSEAAFLALPAAGWIVQQIAAALCALGVSYVGSKVMTDVVTGLTKDSPFDGAEVDADASLLDTTPIDPAAYASPANTVSQVSTTLQTPIHAPLFSQESLDAMHGAVSAAQSTSPKSPNTPWWKKILKWLGGGIMAFFSWLAGLLAMLGINITAEALAGIIVGLGAVAGYLIPKISYWMHKAMNKHAIAEVQFKTTNGDEISGWFSYEDCVWHFGYRGARLASKTHMSIDDAQSIFSTKFFTRFKNECEKTITAILNDDKRFTAVSAAVLAIKDKKIAKEYKSMLEARDSITNGLQNPKVVAD